MKWVITGGCGFIGRSLAADLLTNDTHRVRVLDNLSVGSREDLAAVAPFSEGTARGEGWEDPLNLTVADITDSQALDAVSAGADVMVHLAANTGVPQSVEDPVQDCHTNVLGTLGVLEACRRGAVGRMIFASSGAPLGVQTPPLHEELAAHPASPYGASKLAGEGYCSAYFHCYGVETVTLRFGNVYGEGSGHKTSVVAKFIKQAMAGEALEIYGDGAQTRDFIHISDLVRAIRRAAEARGVGGETYQIAASRETTVAELATELVRALEAEGLNAPDVFNGSHRTGDVARNFSDTTKAAKQLEWSASIALSDGLRRTVRSFMTEDTTGLE